MLCVSQLLVVHEYLSAVGVAASRMYRHTLCSGFGFRLVGWLAVWESVGDREPVVVVDWLIDR